LSGRSNYRIFASVLLILMIAGSTQLLVPTYLDSYLAVPVACGQPVDEYPFHGPRIDELIFKYYATLDAQVAAIQRGEIEEMSDITRVKDIEVLSKDPNINMTFNLQTHYCYIAFNLRRVTTDDVNFRKAAAHLIPREQIANELFGGVVVTPMLYEVPPSFGKWHNPNVKTYPYNVEQAKKVLEEAGYTLGPDGMYVDPTGRPMREISFISPTQEEAPTSFEIVRIITDSMRSIGINAKQEAVAFDALLTRVYTDRDFDIYFLCVSNLGKYPRWLFDFYHSSLDVPDGDNSPGVRNDELDRLLTQFRHEDETEEQAREHALKAQEIIADIVARTPVYSRYQIEATRKGWTGQIVSRGQGYFAPGAWAWLTVHKEGQPFGGTFSASVGGRVRTLNPMFDTGAYDQKIWNLIYEGLAFSDPEGDLIPGLAAGWDVEDVTLADSTLGKKITYHLNQNVTWQDGAKLTSKDVKFTYDYVIQQQVPIWLPNVEQIESVEAPDDYTVVITLKSRGFFVFLDASSVPIVPEHIWHDVGENWRQFVPSQEAHPTVPGLTKEIGTGPFILTEFRQDEYWRMIWNPLYFKRHPSKTFQVEATSVPQSLTQGDKTDLKVTVKSYAGEPVADAAVVGELAKDGNVVLTLPFTSGGNGIYNSALDTANIEPGAYSLVLRISRSEGALTQTGSMTYPLEVKAPFPLVPVAAAVIVVLIAAGYVVVRRAKPKTRG